MSQNPPPPEEQGTVIGLPAQASNTTCPSCGAPLETTDTFCEACGARADGTAPAPQPPAVAPSAVEGKQRPLFALLVLVWTVIMIGALYFLWGSAVVVGSP